MPTIKPTPVMASEGINIHKIIMSFHSTKKLVGMPERVGFIGE